MLPVSVIIVTKDINPTSFENTLNALKPFQDIWVVNSGKNKDLESLCSTHQVTYHQYEWNGQYPKKRQWCLNNLGLKHRFVFFVDADEIVSPTLIGEINNIFKEDNLKKDGYFVKGRYVVNGQICRFGITNNKLCLFDKTKFAFPEIDDLGIEGMGEIEGHYQPIPIVDNTQIGQCKNALYHHAFEDWGGWNKRHQKYAKWEAEMIMRNAYPKDPNQTRETFKRMFRALPFRNVFAFCHSYVLKLGILDGMRGFKLAQSRYKYYRYVAVELRALRHRK